VLKAAAENATEIHWEKRRNLENPYEKGYASAMERSTAQAA
jgi:hypothetical protein